ncbi:hypothetical protein SAMN05216270_12366 [Glycomyces harbinensis]|uniref:Uncharacterized protein n=1 Tax=Glycomyces harbinensis TaxID=58114 RepID=A0A1G7D8M9_9ACTN|nr:hypothetical protein SAMN05216270_12366 [Glycomyces harbinensis]
MSVVCGCCAKTDAVTSVHELGAASPARRKAAVLRFHTGIGAWAATALSALALTSLVAEPPRRRWLLSNRGWAPLRVEVRAARDRLPGGELRLLRFQFGTDRVRRVGAEDQPQRDLLGP